MKLKSLKKLWNKIRNKDDIFKTSLIIFSLSLISMMIFICLMVFIQIIPIKYIIITLIAIVIFYAILAFLLFNKNQSKFMVRLAQVLCIVSGILLLVGSFYINAFNHFLNEIEIGDTNKTTYILLAKKDNKWFNSAIGNIKDPIGVLQSENIELAKNKIEELKTQKQDYSIKEAQKSENYTLIERMENLKKYKQEYKEYTNINNLLDDLYEGNIYVICLEESYANLLSSESEDFDTKTKKIYTFEVDVPAFEANRQTNKNNNDEPFVVYLRGVDRNNDAPEYQIESYTTRGYSDINILIAINPKTQRVAVINTPPDYYVQMSETEDLKDRLTNVGLYGVEKNVHTMESLFDVDIDYYFLTDFNKMTQLVDAIGGIDIVADKSFKTESNSSVYIEKGTNHLNGNQALAYAREGLTYQIENENRGKYQQQIIDAIIERLTESNVFWSHFCPLVMQAGKAIKTNMPVDTMKELIRNQITYNYVWNVETYNVEGSSDKQPIYSLGSDSLVYVMQPNENSLNMAKDKIKNVLENAR